MQDQNVPGQSPIDDELDEPRPFINKWSLMIIFAMLCVLLYLSFTMKRNTKE